MNAFADWLLRVLLGWTGTAANSVWNSVVNAAGGISDFFTRFWLPMVLLLILAGTLMDYTVWFVRWRPYLVWRSWFRRRYHQLRREKDARILEHADMDADTLGTIAQWVATPQDAYPVPQLEQDYDGYNAAAPPLQEFPQPYAPQTPWVFSPAQETQWGSDFPPNAAEATSPEAFFGYSAPGSQEIAPLSAEGFDPLLSSWGTSAPVPPAFEDPESLLYQPSPIQRKRRSERTRAGAARQLLSTLRDKVGQGDDEESMLDGLPSPVRQEDAFHEAIYPSNYNYRNPDNTQ